MASAFRKFGHRRLRIVIWAFVIPSTVDAITNEQCPLSTKFVCLCLNKQIQIALVHMNHCLKVRVGMFSTVMYGCSGHVLSSHKGWNWFHGGKHFWCLFFWCDQWFHWCAPLALPWAGMCTKVVWSEHQVNLLQTERVAPWLNLQQKISFCPKSFHKMCLLCPELSSANRLIWSEAEWFYMEKTSKEICIWSCKDGENYDLVPTSCVSKSDGCSLWRTEVLILRVSMLICFQMCLADTQS